MAKYFCIAVIKQVKEIKNKNIRGNICDSFTEKKRESRHAKLHL